MSTWDFPPSVTITLETDDEGQEYLAVLYPTGTLNTDSEGLDRIADALTGHADPDWLSIPERRMYDALSEAEA